MKRLIIGISGASGAIYGVRMLQVLRDVPDIETHLILSQAARQTLAMETDLTVREVQALADVVHDARDIAASISSGSFKTAGMVILPCSMKTLSGIVHSYTDGLLTRAADVVLKQHVNRETDKYNAQGTTSTTALCMIFHALQAALIEETGYQAEQFALIHPGGAVGERLNHKAL